MRRITILLLTMVLCVSCAACGSRQKRSGKDDTRYNAPDALAASTPAAAAKESIEHQLSVIAQSSSLWLDNMDAESYGFAVVDLDHNGRLEIIFSSCQGTGVYSHNQVWEINKAFNAIHLCEAEMMEGDSQADIMVQSVPSFYDSGSNVSYYVFGDLTKNGPAEYYENKRAISLQEGKIFETPLAYKSTVYSNSGTTITCTDADGKQIREEDYDTIEDRVLGRYEKHCVFIGWITNAMEPIKEMDAERLYCALKESYNAFAVD